MIPAGYMAKRIVKRPDWLAVPGIDDIYSISSCMSKSFADYVTYWRHNGYWLFDSPDVIAEVAKENAVDLGGTKLFYYEVYDRVYRETSKT